MSQLLGFVLLALVFVIAFGVSASSTRARTVAVPVAIGITAGLFSVQIANVHLFTPIVFAWFLARAGHGETNVRWTTFALPLVCAPIALTVFFGDLVVNPLLALQLMALACSATLLVAGWSEELRRPLLLGLLTATTASSLLGLLQVAHVVPTDLWHVDVSALGRPTGFYPEPDWLGMYAGIGALLSWRLGLPPKIRIAIVLVNLSALVLAFARAAWLGFGIAAAAGVLLWLFARGPRERVMGNGKTGRLRAILFTGAALVAAVIALPDLRRDLVTRLSSTLTAQVGDVSAQARVEQNRTLTALAESAPWYGHGLSASGRVGVSGIFYSEQSLNSVASNWVLGLWVDSAWLSIPLFTLVLVLILRSARRTEGALILMVAANSFFSNAIVQPIFWMLLALALVSSGTNDVETVTEVQPHRRKGQVASSRPRPRPS